MRESPSTVGEGDTHQRAMDTSTSVAKKNKKNEGRAFEKTAVHSFMPFSSSTSLNDHQRLTVHTKAMHRQPHALLQQHQLLVHLVCCMHVACIVLAVRTHHENDKSH